MSFTRRALAVLVAASAVLLPLAPAAPAQAARGTVYEGDGDDIIRFKTPTTKPGLVKVTYEGDGYFSVWGLKPSGKENDLLVSTTEAYSGVTAYNVDSGSKTAAVSIKADAPWTVQFLPLTKAKYWAVTSKGSGDQVLRLTKTSSGFHTLKVRYTGDGYFSVWALNAYGKRLDLLVSSVKAYSGRVKLPAGTRYAVVKGDAPGSVGRK